ncbi:hypothetical protein TPA0910_87110 [Streptomyces hygroscopicus subsp. sporocinereus]|uniref:Uncharacterized protein n=1 Tax=Streptomyces hygroscopicus TaxID=1912 RepID=A0ABQ3UF93_STRHY|nr:hypothetical protein [Streptomyces hygroscopicus]GHJ34278.1 hypothetical protein TPA0910_87110 [Streptomyces hygroscopicus]
MTNTQPDITDKYAAQAGMSRYDFLEFEAFASKVDREGYSYAVENYGPEFESEALRRTADDSQALRALYRQHRPLVDAWWAEAGAAVACDLHNAHVDEARQRKEDARLWGISCTDGYVITCDTQEYRDHWAADMRETHREGWRMPAALLSRTVPGGEWTEDSRF